MNRTNADQLSGGVFFIGLALVFLTGWWWPGIMFVIGATALAQALAEGRRWYAAQGALWSFGIGVVFLFGFSLPLLFLLIGAGMIFGWWSRDSWDDEDEEYDDEKPKNISTEQQYRVGDDGELIPYDEDPKQQRR
ncbi:MAG: hypothetical protein MUF87_01010 [Anaerolineae bacterium]|jgi:hypothetical protein|nr:hypothetical protein [Anaerolineae bacterium]